jgi:ribosomal protein S4
MNQLRKKKNIKKVIVLKRNKKRVLSSTLLKFEYRYVSQINKLWKDLKKQDKIPFILKKKRKKITALHAKINSKLPELFFKFWLKGQFLPLTTKQKWLAKQYSHYKALIWNDRNDFFKTILGKTLALTEYYTEEKTQLLSGRSLFRRYGLKKVPTYDLRSWSKLYFRSMYVYQQGWYFENLISIKPPLNARHFPLFRPKTAFQDHWMHQIKEPWLNSLLFKRWTFFGMVEKYKKNTGKRNAFIKPYLRKKNPRFEKRNKLYYWRKKLLFNAWHKNIIQKNKAQRIKHILGKLYRPFYGHLNTKQFTKLVKKSRRKKSKVLSRNEILLSNLENRLDVVVYRLNLAPTILWARRLIWEGCIFVNNPKQSQGWISMHADLKKLAFPLKLRDPKNLYKTTFWNPNQRLSKYKFFLKPITKIDFLVQSNDLIQCTTAISINHIKVKPSLFYKPWPKNLFAFPKTEYVWNQGMRVARHYSFRKWQQATPQITSAMVVSQPNLIEWPEHDRVSELFLRWVTL